MKKLAFLLALILVVSMPLEAAAATRSATRPQLSFSGTTAKCSVVVTGDNTSQYIQVSMTLMCGTTTVASWSGSGYGYVYLSETATVTKGNTYKLVVQVAVDGVFKDPVYITRTR